MESLCGVLLMKCIQSKPIFCRRKLLDLLPILSDLKILKLKDLFELNLVTFVYDKNL